MSDKKRRPWTSEEDDILRRRIKSYGLNNWAMVADGLPGRNGKSCSERWRIYLTPGVKRPTLEPFNEYEVAVVFLGQRVHGNLWSSIAKLLPGRTNTAIKNLWKVALQNPDAERVVGNRYIQAGHSLESLLASPPPDHATSAQRRKAAAAALRRYGAASRSLPARTTQVSEENSNDEAKPDPDSDTDGQALADADAQTGQHLQQQVDDNGNAAALAGLEMPSECTRAAPQPPPAVTAAPTEAPTGVREPCAASPGSAGSESSSPAEGKTPGATTSCAEGGTREAGGLQLAQEEGRSSTDGSCHGAVLDPPGATAVKGSCGAPAAAAAQHTDQPGTAGAAAVAANSSSEGPIEANSSSKILAATSSRPQMHCLPDIQLTAEASVVPEHTPANVSGSTTAPVSTPDAAAQKVGLKPGTGLRTLVAPGAIETMQLKQYLQQQQQHPPTSTAAVAGTGSIGLGGMTDVSSYTQRQLLLHAQQQQMQQQWQAQLFLQSWQQQQQQQKAMQPRPANSKRGQRRRPGRAGSRPQMCDSMDVDVDEQAVRAAAQAVASGAIKLNPRVHPAAAAAAAADAARAAARTAARKAASTAAAHARRKCRGSAAAPTEADVPQVVTEEVAAAAAAGLEQWSERDSGAEPDSCLLGRERRKVAAGVAQLVAAETDAGDAAAPAVATSAGSAQGMQQQYQADLHACPDHVHPAEGSVKLVTAAGGAFVAVTSSVQGYSEYSMMYEHGLEGRASAKSSQQQPPLQDPTTPNSVAPVTAGAARLWDLGLSSFPSDHGGGGGGTNDPASLTANLMHSRQLLSAAVPLYTDGDDLPYSAADDPIMLELLKHEMSVAAALQLHDTTAPCDVITPATAAAVLRPTMPSSDPVDASVLQNVQQRQLDVSQSEAAAHLLPSSDATAEAAEAAAAAAASPGWKGSPRHGSQQLPAGPATAVPTDKAVTDLCLHAPSTSLSCSTVLAPGSAVAVASKLPEHGAANSGTSGITIAAAPDSCLAATAAGGSSKTGGAAPAVVTAGDVVPTLVPHKQVPLAMTGMPAGTCSAADSEGSVLTASSRHSSAITSNHTSPGASSALHRAPATQPESGGPLTQGLSSGGGYYVTFTTPSGARQQVLVQPAPATASRSALLSSSSAGQQQPLFGQAPSRDTPALSAGGSSACPVAGGQTPPGALSSGLSGCPAPHGQFSSNASFPGAAACQQQQQGPMHSNPVLAAMLSSDSEMSAHNPVLHATMAALRNHSGCNCVYCLTSVRAEQRGSKTAPAHALGGCASQLLQQGSGQDHTAAHLAALAMPPPRPVALPHIRGSSKAAVATAAAAPVFCESVEFTASRMPAAAGRVQCSSPVLHTMCGGADLGLDAGKAVEAATAAAAALDAFFGSDDGEIDWGFDLVDLDALDAPF